MNLVLHQSSLQSMVTEFLVCFPFIDVSKLAVYKLFALVHERDLIIDVLELFLDRAEVPSLLHEGVYFLLCELRDLHEVEPYSHILWRMNPS
jgi:hypothetical protein